MAGRAFEFPVDGSVEFEQPRTIMAESLPKTAAGAVIIPAHNESGVMARTLGALAPLAAVDGIEIIVVCNGSVDDTATIAEGFTGVQVAQIDRASKTDALNLGDELATAWPRLYLDADIEVDPRSVLAVFDALGEPGVYAARARYVYDATGANLPVRCYHRARSRVTASPNRLWGAGGYATNEEGHRRFGRFPDLVADDSWFDQQFTAEEKRVVPSLPMRVRTPSNLTDLIAVLSRRRRGYLQLGGASEASSRLRTLVSSIRGPRTAFDAAWYVLVTLAARRRAAKAVRTGAKLWDRDASSRGKAQAE